MVPGYQASAATMITCTLYELIKRVNWALTLTGSVSKVTVHQLFWHDCIVGFVCSEATAQMELTSLLKSMSNAECISMESYRNAPGTILGFHFLACMEFQPAVLLQHIHGKVTVTLYYMTSYGRAIYGLCVRSLMLGRPLTHSGLVTPSGVTDLGHYWLR